MVQSIIIIVIIGMVGLVWLCFKFRMCEAEHDFFQNTANVLSREVSWSLVIDLQNNAD